MTKYTILENINIVRITPTTKSKVIHNFLKHYEDGKFNAFEEKTIVIIWRGHKTSYEISAQKHKDYYASENPEEVVDDFLKNLRTKFKPKNYFVIKCGFSIENYHPALIEKDPPITDAPY